MKKILKCGTFLLAAASGLFYACKNEPVSDADGVKGEPFRIIAEIVGANTAGSRVEKDDFGSFLSNASGGRFEEGTDRIGLYTLADAEGDATKGYNNLCLTYSNGSFSSEALGNIEHPGNLGYVFGYFEYDTQNSESADNVLGMYDESGRVRDILVAGRSGLNSSTVSLAFEHAFSMLFVIPGEGFEQAAQTQESIQIVLKQRMQARVDKSESSIDLVMEPSDNGSIPISFTAEKAENVTLMGQEEIPVCYYAILPSGAEVDYIRMTDNAGKIQYIRPDAGKLPKLVRAWRYPVEVRMEGVSSTLWPLTFSPWTDETSLVLREDAGIDSADEFEEWMDTYNEYTGGDTSAKVLDALARYGTRDETDETKWIFRLNRDIDCSQLFTGTGGTKLSSLIATLKDTFDGRNHTLTNLSNLVLSGGLVGTVEEGGMLTGLNVEGIRIESSETGAVGALANRMTGGEITDCSVTDIYIETEGRVGALVGEATGGGISGNLANGLLFGSSSSDDRVTGSREAGVTCSGNRCSGIIFQSVN